jgi:phosphopantetheinyl transferase
MFMLYGTSELPDIITQPEGRPVFADPDLPRFSIAYTGNIIGVALTTEGDCGLDMELQRATRSFHGGNAHEDYPLSSNEKLWVRNQNDPVEARAQLITLRQSIRKLCGCASDDASLLQLLARLRTSARHSGHAGRSAQRRRGCAHLVHCGYPRHRTHENLGI